ncbi:MULTISPECIES: matrixin family metalloprotease [Paenibacillus]|uniref:Matrixin n=1 Tax=Paenibacillus pabuli TaxID=1472 RepID=A0A855XX49_9BACL|nr:MULTISPECIES: matrixin family metalloprotease [Paenibacillus]PWW42343.1 matrixin [Paenibacillus pabuli]PXW07731.1 matrixin [Paenibacillus taichungensis]RAI94507.1 matrixin [Paenibacillus pabuli]
MKSKKFFSSLLIAALFLSSSTLAHANETEVWRFYSKNMTYKVDSGISSLMQKGWTNAVTQWNEKGMNLYSNSSSINTLGVFNEVSSTLYGRMQTWYNTDTFIVTKFQGGLNIGNSNITGSNVATSTATHEIGHAMGLKHNNNNSIMNSARNRSNLWFPTSYDVQTMTQIYAGTIGWNAIAASVYQPQVPTDVNISYDFPTTNKLEEMVQESDIIVIGEYQDGFETWNMLRDPNNSQKESEEAFVEGQLYDFKIDNVIKGNVDGGNIKVNHRAAESLTLKFSEDVEEQVTVSDLFYIAPKTKSKYVLFLKQNKELDNYYGAIEPFSVTIDDNNFVKLNSNIIGSEGTSQEFQLNNVTVHNDILDSIEDNISGMSLEELLNKVTAVGGVKGYSK